MTLALTLTAVSDPHPDSEEERLKLLEIIEYMKADHKLLNGEVKLFDDALHTMVTDIIGLQNEQRKLERKDEER